MGFSGRRNCKRWEAFNQLVPLAAEEHRDVAMPVRSLDWAVEYVKDLMTISESLGADCNVSVSLEYGEGGSIRIVVLDD